MGFDYDIIGLAPWVSTSCARSFLVASQRMRTRALIFFQPESKGIELPPLPVDRRWGLGDQGNWESQNSRYPIYAVSGPAGAMLMDQLSMLSESCSNGDAQSSTDCAGEWDPLPDSQLGPMRLFTVIGGSKTGKFFLPSNLS